VSDTDPEPKLETTRLGSYAIVRKLARGGMAELYLARSVGPEGFEKLVVLKKILPRYAENPRFVQLFLDEAKLAASLDHPHIAHVYDMGRVDGNYFFTMEYVHGQDVRSILRRTERAKRQIPIELTVQIARNIASALHYAHERRHGDGTLRDIVHRDVSPSNILVSYDGAIKLADFGVAKASNSSVRTRTGTLKGKVGYMSPEQARGAAIDRRSDIFSLGVVLWELVAIRRLFKCDNDLATIQSIINSPPPSLVEVREDCPPELDRIARRALEKDPATRYQTAQELQRDLEELAREHKLNQSSIAISGFLNELFEAEIAAWREAQASGKTVTDFLVASDLDLTTPVSESELSLDDSSFPNEELDDDEGDDEAEADDAEGAREKAEKPSEPPLPPLAGVISKSADLAAADEKTDFAPPPVMIDSQVTKVPDEPEDLAATALQENAFSDGNPTATQVEPFSPTTPSAILASAKPTLPNAFTEDPPTVKASEFPDELPTVQVERSMVEELLAADEARPSSVRVAPQTPPIGIPEMPLPVQREHSRPASMGVPQGLPAGPYPLASSLPSQPAGFGGWDTVNLTPQRRILVLGGVAVGLLVLIIILAVALDSGSEPTAATIDAAEVAPPPPTTKQAAPPAPALIMPKPAAAPLRDGSGSSAGSATSVKPPVPEPAPPVMPPPQPIKTPKPFKPPPRR
jgi:serine/threonine protein kinase